MAEKTGTQRNAERAVQRAISKATAPRVSLEIGGRTRTLLMDLNAMCLIEEQTGHDLLNSADVFNNPSVRDVRVILWACLVHDDPTLEDAEAGIKQVGSWVTLENLTEISAALTMTFTQALPEKADGAEAPKN